MLFLEITAGELLIAFCRSILKGINTPVGTSASQARIAAASRSYSKNFCNDRLKSGQWYSPLPRRSLQGAETTVPAVYTSCISPLPL
jgi:hypothetical protein